ncbi:MAG: UvrD-helicase domain-containing protein [Myxococcota bacterium]|nr:UvrD-helicase domain-containing protein [Myxococcota bacterium]
MSVHLEGLNPEQRAAVLKTEGALLVLAGAGSGKTRVITYRLAWLLERGTRPEDILALTFTNKAAQEMRERAALMVGATARRCTLSTFHSLGVRFLREEASAVGRTSRFTILDEGDQRAVVKDAIIQQGLDPKKFQPPVILARLSDFKGQLQRPVGADPESRCAAMIFETYERRLRLMNAVDFDDLIRLPVLLMEENPEVGARWGRRYRYLMVDEYQDSNGAQLRLLKALSRGWGNLCVVGDDDQSIYGWRGAVASNILKFDKHFPGAEVIALTQNYRSTNYILRAANAVIGHNEERHPKTLWSALGDGEKLRYRCLSQGEEEARWVLNDLLSWRQRERRPWSDFALLYRTNQQARIFEELARSLQIPYRVLGGSQFFDRKEIRDLFAYLRLLVNPLDEAALRRVINYPPRGIGDGTLQRLLDHSAESGRPLWHLCARPEEVQGIQRAQSGHLKRFVEEMRTLATEVERRPWGELGELVLDRFKFRDALAEGAITSKKSEKRWGHLQEALQGLERAHQRAEGDLASYLNYMSLEGRREREESEDVQVTLMSLHSSKGLEFPCVYLVGFEEEWLPLARVIDESGSAAIAEERRLLYVGITRAKYRLTLTSARRRLSRSRLVPRRASRFIKELPSECFAGGLDGEADEAEREASRERGAAAIGALVSLLKGE